MEQIEHQEELTMAPSEDFFDFITFQTLVKEATRDSTVASRFKLKSQTSGEYAEKTKMLYKRAILYEKMILQNPSFVPYDAFHDIFHNLKIIQIRYAPDAKTVWEHFLTTPTFDFAVQYELQQWASEKAVYGVTAKLWQMMEATDSLRFNSQTVLEIISFTQKMTSGFGATVDATTRRQMTHIATSILDMLSDKTKPVEEDLDAVARREVHYARACTDILLHFEMYAPLAGFVQDRAVSIYGTKLTESILNQIMEHAAKKE